jgi:galactokinase
MTGGGFGGCTINLVKSEAVADGESVSAHHGKPDSGEIFVSSAAEEPAKCGCELPTAQPIVPKRR